MRHALIVLLGGLALQGCAYHRLVVENGVPPDPTYHVVESSAVGWNVSEPQALVASECATDLLFEVRTRTSFLQSLATVLTLGFWQPARMEYVCAAVPTEPGTSGP